MKKNTITLICTIYILINCVTHAAIIAEYDADAGTPIENPSAQGWAEDGIGAGVTVGGIVDSGTSAWQIFDNSGSLRPRYEIFLTTGDLQTMFNSGWTFEFTARAIQSTSSCAWGIAAASDPGWGLTNRERVGFVFENSGGAFAITPTHGTTITLVAGSADQFHTIKCVGMPLSSQYEFFIDNVSYGMFDIKDGSSNSSQDDRVIFHSGSTGGVGLEAYWHQVSLTVPESVLVFAVTDGSTKVSEQNTTTDSYTIRLASTPSAPVTVTITPDGGPAPAGNIDLGSGAGIGIEKTFTTSDWSIPQEIQVTAVDDGYSEGDHNLTIRNLTSSTDSAFNGILSNISVEISDNDLIEWDINFMSKPFISPKGSYVTDQENYHTFRIPGMVLAADGSLLTFAEGRRGDGSDPRRDDNAPMDMVMRRSTDNGETWADLLVIDSGFQPNDIKVDFANPTPTLDKITGKIVLLYGQAPDIGTSLGDISRNPDSTDNNRVVWVKSSADNGLTWSARTQILYPNIPNDTPDGLYWRQAQPGPGSGIQLQYQDSNPSLNGRLVIPAKRSGSTTPANSAIVNPFAYYSDDHGATWNVGNVTEGPSGNEDEVVELNDGSILLDARQSGGSFRRRHISTDAAISWGPDLSDDVAITTVDCSLARYSSLRQGQDRNRILFSGPLGPGRSNAAVWVSYDEGKSFINPAQVNEESAAYSVVARLADGSIGAFFETAGEETYNLGQSYGDITLYNFDLPYIEGMNHPAELTHYDGFGNKINRKRGGVGWSGLWIGDATFASTYAPEFNGPSINFENFRFITRTGRMDLVNGQTARRLLATPIDLNSNATTYVSLLISQALDNSADDNVDEFLNIELQSSDATTQASFGVKSNEQFYVDALGDLVETSNDALLQSKSYFMIAKIVSQDDSSGQNNDRIFLKVFESGTDTIPNSETGLSWTLAGTTSENSGAVLEQIVLTGGSEVIFSLDELRTGTTYESVAFNTMPNCPVTLPTDLNEDCYVNLGDLMIIAQNWLKCTDPGNPAQCD